MSIWWRVGVLTALGIACLADGAASEAQLERTLRERFEGDRTGTCVLAAVIERETVVRGRYCALPRPEGPPAMDAAFEIGSITKTMTAMLVADLVREGKWSLDDPIAKHLPEGTRLPRQGERQILVRDLVTHSSGLPALPALMKPERADDPYATLTERQLLDSLALVKLDAPIGSQASYSNFGMMVLSLAVARAHGGDFEGALRRVVFEPLQMKGAYVSRAPAGQPVAQGHLPTRQPTAAWTIPPAFAGVGMVRATLDDMVRYAQAALKPGATMAMTLKPLAHRFGMNWIVDDSTGDRLIGHEGGTGGFSSALYLRPGQSRAVVLLADTALSDLGGLDDLAAVLLHLRAIPQPPRVATPVPANLRDAMVGEYHLAGMRTRVRADGTRLFMQAEGQSEFELLHDSRGDLYPSTFSALLTPVIESGRVTRFAWRQGGGMIEATRLGAEMAATAQNPAWRAWAGEYGLAPQFDLRVFERDGRLMVQGTGQPAIAAEVVGDDHIEVKAVGAVIRFQRNAAGEVTGLTLTQRGNTLPGKRR